MTKTIEIELPALYPAQHAALFAPERMVVIEASTKAGKTFGAIVWQMAQCLERVGNHWWVAPVYTQARIAYERVKEYLPDSIYKAHNTRLELTFINGSVWSFKSAEKPDNLYGDDTQSAVIDEASRLREAAYMAIRSTLTATQGPMRMIGNVKGRGNWFYKLARRAQSGAHDYAYFKLTALDAVEAGVFPRSEYEAAKADLSEADFLELYMAQAADDGGNPFGVAAIDACVGGLSTAEPVAWGWDVARSVDWTVGVALDAGGNVCRFVRFQQDWGTTKDRIQAETGGCWSLLDSTGVGDAILEDLQSRGMNLEGFKFSSSSKQQLMIALSSAIQQGIIRFPAGPIVDELDAFEFYHTRTGVRYSAPPGLHDDCVCALALAWTAYQMTLSAAPILGVSLGGGHRF